MKYKNEFIIHTTKQLIDINKGLTNFKANINIVSNNQDDDFDIVILTQKDLDNVDFDINYKNIIHNINIDVESTNNTQNQFINSEFFSTRGQAQRVSPKTSLDFEF